MASEKNKIADPQHILAIKFSSIGDIVLTTSPIKTLKTNYPNANIDFLTRSDFVPLIEGLNCIDNIISFDRSSGLIKLIKTGKWINKSKYDLIIDFHDSLRSKIIRSFIRYKKVLIIKKPRWLRFLLFRFRKNLFPKDFNQIQLLHEPIKKLIRNSDHEMPELFVSKTEIENAKELIKQNGIGKDFIAIIPGAAWPQKTWSANNYNILLQKIKKIKKFDFVLLGGQIDEICNSIASFDVSYLNLQGQTNLRESMAIIAIAQFCIGADTGLIHSAEALGKNVVTILGPTARETGAGTNRPDSVLIQNEEIWCRPCSQSGKRKCYRDQQFCMTTITPEIVMGNIKGLLN